MKDILEWIVNEASRGLDEGDTREALIAIKWKAKDALAEQRQAERKERTGLDVPEALALDDPGRLVPHHGSGPDNPNGPPRPSSPPLNRKMMG